MLDIRKIKEHKEMTRERMLRAASRKKVALSFCFFFLFAFLQLSLFSRFFSAYSNNRPKLLTPFSSCTCQDSPSRNKAAKVSSFFSFSILPLAPLLPSLFWLFKTKTKLLLPSFLFRHPRAQFMTWFMSFCLLMPFMI